MKPSEFGKERILSLVILPIMTVLAVISTALMFGVYMGRFNVGHASIPLISYVVCRPLEVILLLAGIPLLVLLNWKWNSPTTKSRIYAINTLWLIAVATNLGSILRLPL